MIRNDDEPLGPNIGGARNIARNLLKNAGATTIPISLYVIVGYMKTRHDLMVVRSSFDKIDGMLAIPDDGPPTIAFNLERPWVRRRFTIAHEIGHYLLGHGGHDETNVHAEKEANQFAGELLMPLAIIKVDYKKDNDLDKLAEKYIVSKEALCWHLMDCRLLMLK